MAGEQAMTLPQTPVIDYDDEFDEPDVCLDCGVVLDVGEGPICDGCTGLRGCVDDMCHGQGWCMHRFGVQP
jgi:hypothetical protein